MKKMKLFLITLTLLVAAKITAWGCVCVGPDNPKEAKKWAQLVFSGEILAFEKEGDQGLFTFRVDRVWKGVAEKQIVLSDPMYGSDCSRGLKVGAHYIIFASYKRYDTPTPNPEGIYLSVDKNGKPRPAIDTCSWSTNLASIKQSKRVLKKIGKGRLIN